VGLPNKTQGMPWVFQPLRLHLVPTQVSAGVPTSMTLNDLELQNKVFSEFFTILGCDAHLLWIFTEISGDRPSQPAYEIKLMLSCSRISWALAQISCQKLRQISGQSILQNVQVLVNA